MTESFNRNDKTSIELFARFCSEIKVFGLALLKPQQPSLTIPAL
jgi:hypothetical protein